MEYVHAQEVYEVGQWLWHTWQSGRFQLTENQGLNPAIRNFYWTHLLYLSRKHENNVKKRPGNAIRKVHVVRLVEKGM